MHPEAHSSILDHTSALYQKMMKGEKPLVMMMKVATARVIVVVIAIAVTMEIMRMIEKVIVKATIVKTMIANIVAMIRVNPLVIERRKM